jgi:aminotransferase
MENVISLGVGEPDFVTPWNVRESCMVALETGKTSYTSNSGLLELREEICRYLSEAFNLNYQPQNEVLVTVGASEAIDLALRAILNPGDEVLVVEPSYISYSPCVALAGGVPVLVRTKAEHRFKLQPEDLEAAITPRTKAIIWCYPNNPTGGVMGREDWLALAPLIEKHNLLVISDEIYAELSYGQTHVSFAEIEGMQERTILISGLSKAFAMTGWRIGYAAAHEEIIRLMTKIHQYTILCAPIMCQYAAIEALRHARKEKDEMVESYRQRRNLIVKSFDEIGLVCHQPEGAFYAFPSIASTGIDDETFAERLLHEAKVAVVPGSVFGPSGRGHIRCSYATSVDNIVEAVDRIGQFIRGAVKIQV